MLNYPAKLYCQLGNQKHNLNPGLSVLKIHSLHFQWLPGQVTLRNTNNKHKALSTSCTCCQPYFKISEPHKHEKASSWMEGISPAEPVPWMWSFGVHGCQLRCPCSNLRGKRLQIVLCKAGNLLPVYLCGCHGDEEHDHAGICCCRGQECRRASGKELSRNSWTWRP